MKNYFSEFLGTLFLSVIVLGSGVMGENLSPGNSALALLCNSLATGFGLYFLITTVSTFSFAHFNPVVSMVEFLNKKITRSQFIIFSILQIIGAIVGVFIVHAMFDQNIVQVGIKNRAQINLYFSEIIATFGLVFVILILAQKRSELIAVNVASYIAAAYWFTSSTSFANPAITIARTFTTSFGGMASDGLGFYLFAQFFGGVIALVAAKAIYAKNEED